MKNKKTLLVSLLFLTTMTTPIITSSLTYAGNNTNPVSANSNKAKASTTKKYSYNSNVGYNQALQAVSKASNTVASSFYTKEGVLFVAGAKKTTTNVENSGIFYSTDNGLTFKFIENSKPTMTGIFNTFAEDTNKTVWVGSTDGLYKIKYNSSEKMWDFTAAAVGTTSLKSDIENIFNFDDKIYLALNDGGTGYNPTGIYNNPNLDSPVFTKTTTSGIDATAAITCITKDSENHFWIGTTKGLWANLTAITPEGTYTLQTSTTPVLNATNSINQIYLGTNKALYISDSNNSVYKATPTTPGKPTTWTFSIFLQVSNPALNKGKVVSFIFEDKSNNLWIGTADTAMSSFSATVLYYGSINSSKFDQTNIIDVPFGGQGISSISEGKQDQLFIGILNNNNTSNSLINATIPNSNSGTGLSGGAIAGVVIGIIAAATILWIVGITVYKNKTKKASISTPKAKAKK